MACILKSLALLGLPGLLLGGGDPLVPENPPPEVLRVPESHLHGLAVEHHDDVLLVLDSGAGGQTGPRSSGNPCFDAQVYLWLLVNELMRVLPVL